METTRYNFLIAIKYYVQQLYLIHKTTPVSLAALKELSHGLRILKSLASLFQIRRL